jgi:hypothetical protein
VQKCEVLIASASLVVALRTTRKSNGKRQNAAMKKCGRPPLLNLAAMA